MKQILQIAFALFCIAFGIDKFYQFLPTCSLISHIPPVGMMVIGVMEILIGIALLLDRYTLTALRLAVAIIIGGILMHLLTGTYDIGGAVLGSVLGLATIFLYKAE